MPSIDQLGEDVKQEISQLIGHRLALAPIADLNKRQKLCLGESIAVTELRRHAVDDEFTSPVFRGRWMNLLKANTRYIGYSLSTPIGPKETDWMVDCVVKAKLAAEISKSLQWIHKKVEGDGVIRLLSVPDYHLHALTITLDNDIRIVVVNIPATVKNLRKHLVYSLKDFLDELIKHPIIQGVKFKPINKS